MTGRRVRGWWEDYRRQLPHTALDLAELEHHANALCVAQALHIPGLLQTPQHARALFGDAVPPLLPHEIEHRISYRIKRQAVLYRGRSLPYTALTHEAALHMQVGGTDVAREQLIHLVELSEAVVQLGGLLLRLPRHHRRQPVHIPRRPRHPRQETLRAR
jgi:hypothetical protein